MGSDKGKGGVSETRFAGVIGVVIIIIIIITVISTNINEAVLKATGTPLACCY